MPPFSSTSPLDGSSLSDVVATDLETLPAKIASARKAQIAWAARPLAERVKPLLTAKDRLLDRAEAIAKEVHREVGKPEVEALLGEVLPSGDVVGYWTTAIEDLLEPIPVELDALAYPGKRGAIERVARGVVAIISPWNFPFALPLRTIVPALLAGNAVVFKPSEISPRTGKLVADLFDGILPDGLFTLVQGGGELGAALTAADVDLVSFTGSVATGRKVAVACAERLVMCSLELGGKDAAIVLADANLERAANGIVWGAMMNAGQNCGAVERVYVEKSVAKELTEKIAAATKALRFGDDVGPLTTEAQRAVVEKHVDAAKEAGAKLLCGGKRGDDGYEYAPTALTITGDESPLMADETFGPVVPIATVADVDEAVKRANASRYGLTASVWTRDLGKGEEIARRLRAGVVTINNHSFTGAIPGAPWTGVGESGFGVTNSPFALDTLTRPRFILIDRGRAKKELWWYPYTPTLRALALAFATLRSGTKGIGEKIRAVFALLGAFLKRGKE